MSRGFDPAPQGLCAKRAEIVFSGGSRSAGGGARAATWMVVEATTADVVGARSGPEADRAHRDPGIMSEAAKTAG